jgi:peptidoglycan-associated lipoprotein
VLEEHVLFDFQRARVKSAARPVLAAIAELVRQHPEWVRMRIEGHADARGDADYNRTLSQRRARNVMRALVRIGIDSTTLESAGFGTDRLRDEGTTEQAHQRNRRVEFVVVARRAPEGDTGNAAEPDLVFESGPVGAH